MEQVTLRTETDTATPRPVIPIFLFHSVKTPFCNQSGCWCQSGKAEAVKLMAAIQHGDMVFRNASDFEERKQV